jgi:glutaredoxin
MTDAPTPPGGSNRGRIGHRMRSSIAPWLLAAALSLGVSAGVHAAPPVPQHGFRLGGSVTMYGAAWCKACKSLEAKLDKKEIPFRVVDVDRNREDYERARAAAGGPRGIPLTGVLSSGEETWIVGDDADRIERAYRGN